MLYRKHTGRDLDPRSRRRFLKLLGAAMAAPAASAALGYDAHELFLGEAFAQANAEANRPVYFIEINMRDQWDFGQMFVAPGLATHANLRRGATGRRCAMYVQQEQMRREQGVYLTPDSVALAPHVDSIAMIETCELTMGRIHGHEAANALRSPGRSRQGGPGRRAMYEGEPGYSEQGNEPHHSSTPTPASLHNYWQKQLDPTVKNGLAFKGISRFHTVYHYGAGMPGSELTRFQSVQSLRDAFPNSVEDYNILPAEQEAQALEKMLGRLDARFLEERRYVQSVQDDHAQQLSDAQKIVWAGEPKLFSLDLTEEERAYWSAGVPAQRANPAKVKANIWEQVAYAFKLVSNDAARTVALEFDYVDVHDTRTEDQMRVMTLQAALPLARLIEQLEAAGIYQDTVIAMYSTDGGRSPAGNSTGNEGKNTVILAGGKIKGGYYGDVRVAGNDGDGHRYGYHMPDLTTGQPIASGTTGNDKRLAGKHVWRTLMHALGVPDHVAGQFADVQDGQVLSWLLR